MTRYSPPADIDDLAARPTREAFLNDWHDFIEGEFRANIEGLKDPSDGNGVLFDTPIPEPLFFTEVDDPATSADAAIPWNAFPLRIRRNFPNDPKRAWKDADVLGATDRFSPNGAPPVSRQFRRQDEYCEWHAYHDAAGRIERIVFTSDGPEYWIKLAAHDLDFVVDAYQRHVSPKVKKQDLVLTEDLAFGRQRLPAGSYNPFNRWNTVDGVMHLTHPANTLGAEINLAAQATILRVSTSGQRVTQVRSFACCSNFGDPNRSSDPNIGSMANLTAVPVGAHKPMSVTLANPVALYMARLAAGVLTDEDGNALDSWFTFVRGTTNHGLMAVLQPPPGSPIGLDKVQVGGIPLERGGQVAEHIEMVLYAKTADLGKPMPPLAPAVGCCCVPTSTPPAAVERLNFEHISKPNTCAKQKMKEAFADCAPAPGAFAVLAKPAPAVGHAPRSGTRLAITD